MDRFEDLGYQLCLRTRCNSKHIPVNMDCIALVFGLGEYFAYSA